MTSISGDTEASGPIPGYYDMISVGLVVIEPSLNRTFYGEFAPLHDNYVQAAYDSIGWTRERHLACPPAEETTHLLFDFLKGLDGGKRVALVSDNPAFDFMMMSWYLHYFIGECPLGWSGRRIADFAAGLKRNWFATQDWKRLRKTKHTHNALDDAMGNAEAVLALCNDPTIKSPWRPKS